MINTDDGNLKIINPYKYARLERLRELNLDCHDRVQCSNGQVYEILYVEVDNIIARLEHATTPCNINPLHITKVL